MTTKGLHHTVPAAKANQTLHEYLLAVSAGPELQQILEGPEQFRRVQIDPSLAHTLSSERMRANLFIDLQQHGATMADGLAVNRAWAEIAARLAHKGAAKVDSNSRRDTWVRGYPEFLTPFEAPEGLVLRKWCKSAAAVTEIARRGYLEAAHSGLNRYDSDYVPIVQFPDVTGVMLADPAADPRAIGWHDLSHHYIDVVFEGAAILHTYHPQKFVAPLPARIRDYAWENATLGVQQRPAASDRDSELMRMVRHQISKAPTVPLRFARIAGSSIGGFVKSRENGSESGLRGDEGGPAARSAATPFSQVLAAWASWKPRFSPAFVPANLALAHVR